jgi:hypothetical protein
MNQTMSLNCTVNEKTATVDLIDAETGDGWHGLQFYLQGENGEQVCTVARQVSREGRTARWRCDLAEGAEVAFEATASPNGGGLWIKPTLSNGGSRPLRFTGYGFRIAPGARGPQLNQGGVPVFAHSENLRYEILPQSRETYPFVRPLPETGRWYGRQGIGPMPVLVLGRLGKDRWLVEGAASQERHMPSWHLDLPGESGRLLEYRSGYFWNGASAESVAPGQTAALESTLYLVVNAAPDSFYEAYIEELAALYGDRFAGPNSRLADEPVYCTWNYGIYFNVSEADCLQRMDVVKKVQGGGIFQLDHGYQPPHAPHGSWGYLDAFYPDTTATWDRKRFPGGPKAIVEQCRQRGLTPAIWWTPRMDVDGPIAREHPEWIARNGKGEPIAYVGDLHPDYSVPEVREFISRTLHTVIKDWGFEGIKLDFFSWAFDAPDLVYRNGGTSVQWRRWLLNLVRRELGPRGYFLYCVSCPLGNPFLALDGCDSFRAGRDIDRGAWEMNVNNCSWLLASLPACGRRTWFADMDSFLGSSEFPGSERRFRCAMGYLTAGMMDFSGPVETFDAELLGEYKRLADRCEQGGRVLVPDRSAYFGRALPRVLARVHEADSRTRRNVGALATVGLFNWDEVPQAVAVSLSQLGLSNRPTRARDFWTEREITLRDGCLVAELQPREHLLVDLLD